MAATGSKLTEMSDKELVRLAVRSKKKLDMDNKPFDELSARYMRMLPPYLSRCFEKESKDPSKEVQSVNLSIQEMDEIVQETLIKAYYKLETYNAKFAFSTWIFRIGLNNTLDLIRKRSRERMETIDEQSEEKGGSISSPEDSMISSQNEERIIALFDSLPETYRETSKLCFLEGLDYKQIAEKQGITEEAVKVRIFRAKQKLTEMIGGTSDGR
jgi:RNA polymerase sigma factor (sigma-70 family)